MSRRIEIETHPKACCVVVWESSEALLGSVFGFRKLEPVMNGGLFQVEEVHPA